MGLFTAGGCAWSVYNTNDWVTIDSSPNMTNSGTVTYTVATNPAAMARSGSIIIAGQVFTLTQSGNQLILDPKLLTFDETPPVHTRVVENGYGGLRWNNFGVLNATNQGFGGYLAGMVTTPDVAYNLNGGPASVSGISNLFSLNSAFCTAVDESGMQIRVQGLTGNMVVFDNTYAITGSIQTLINFERNEVDCVTFIPIPSSSLFGMDNLSLAISGTPICTFAIAPASWLHGPGADSGSVSVFAAGGCVWGVSNTNTWVTITSKLTNTNNASVTYTVSPNSTGLARTGFITIAGRAFSVTQLGACTFTLSPTNRQHGPGSDSGSVSVSTLAGCAWSVSNTNDWVTITSNLTNTNSASVNYTVASNPTGALRTGFITIAGQAFSVTQLGACTFTISPINRQHGPGSDSGLVFVSTLEGCTWSVSNTNDWVTITSSSSKTNNGTATYALTGNLALASRTGFITIAGQAFSVTQLGACTFTISPSNRAHGPGSDSGSVSVSTLAGCAWSVSNTNDWVTIDSSPNMTNSGTVSYTVATNPTAVARSGSILIAGQAFTVRQSANQCILVPTLLTFDDLSPGSDVVFVPNGYGGMQWNNFGVYNGLNQPLTEGYRTGVLSPSNAVINRYGEPASFSNGRAFNWDSAYLTAAEMDSLPVSVLGFIGTTLAYSNTYSVKKSAPTLINFNYLGVNEVSFKTAPASPFAMDNMALSVPVPVVEILVQPDGNITITFTGVLQYAGDVNGVFTDVPGHPQGTHTIPKTNLTALQYFRARN